VTDDVNRFATTGLRGTFFEGAGFYSVFVEDEGNILKSIVREMIIRAMLGKLNMKEGAKLVESDDLVKAFVLHKLKPVTYTKVNNSPDKLTTDEVLTMLSKNHFDEL